MLGVLTKNLFCMAAISFAAASTVNAADEEKVGLFSLLALEAGSGKTTVSDKGGEIEGQIMMVPLIASATEKLRRAILTEAKDKTIIPSIGALTTDLRPLFWAQSRLKLLERDLGGLDDNPKCLTTPISNDASASDTKEAGIDLSAVGILKTFVSSLKTETTISGIATEASDEMLLNALVSSKAETSSNWFLPQDRSLMFEDRPDGLWERITKLSQKIEKNSAKGCQLSETEKAKVKNANKVIEELTATGEKGAPSLLEKAMLIEGQSNVDLVLSVKIGKSGGTLVKRQNIWTTLGAEALSFSTGLTLSYRLSNPKTGAVIQSGLIVCLSKPKGFREIHNKKALPSTDEDNCKASNGDGTWV